MGNNELDELNKKLFAGEVTRKQWKTAMGLPVSDKDDVYIVSVSPEELAAIRSSQPE
jgi:hypothetical protein